MPNSLKVRKIIFLLILVLVGVSVALGVLHRNDWMLPEDAKTLKNPLQPSEAALNAARGLYRQNCVECHGDSGKGDGPDAMMYDPAPADLTDAKHMSKLTDGQIYYQITQGKKPMPSFKKKLTQEQRWQLVLLVRTFSAPAAAPASKSDASPHPTP